MKLKCCENCWYWSDPKTSVCVNDQSEHCANFVGRDDYCPAYRKRLTLDDIRKEDGQGE